MLINGKFDLGGEVLVASPILFYKVVSKKMIQVTKEQVEQIRKKLPHEHVTMTNRQSRSKAKTYYVPESYAVMKLLREMQYQQKIEHYE